MSACNGSTHRFASTSCGRVQMAVDGVDRTPLVPMMGR
jgi:hypothetical protein